MINFRRSLSVFEICFLIVSTFAFAYVFAISIPVVSAESLRELGLDYENQFKVQNGLYIHPTTNIPYRKEGGNYVRADVPQNTNTNGVTNTQVPSSNPTTNPYYNPYAAGQIGAQAPVGGNEQTQALSAVASTFGQLGSLLTGGFGEALIWSGVIFGSTLAVTSAFGADPSLVQSLSIAAGVGAFAGKVAQRYFELDATTSTVIGAGIGFAVFLLLYEDEKYEAVQFTCHPWQAPVGSTQDVCETCNDDTMPCSEYRCRSLGQTCELVNQGTSEERCVDVNPKDVTPPVITPDSSELTIGYKYTNVKLSPPGPGFEIERTSGDNSCITAFTPLRFGITVDEPAQCKIDFNSTSSFEDMFTYMGGSNLYKYEHSEQFVLPHAKDLGNSTLQLQNGEDLTFFVRCQDRKGNSNEAEYAVKFCVDPSPDTTAPQVKLTSVADASCIPAETDSGVVDFYVNEPSECRWSRQDQAYDSMQNEMSCDTELFQMNALQLYTCQANLTGVSRELTDYYVRCRDQPNEANINDRNTNQESYRFSLRGSNQLKLRSIGPNGTVAGGINPMPVELEVETLFGCNRGVSNCYFSDREDGNYILFGTTNTEDGIHNQTLFLESGNHEYFVKCVDSGGNVIETSTEFFLDIDTSAPIIARIYNDEGQLKISTLRESECSYSHQSCDFFFEEGISMPQDNSEVHFADWDNDETYYIKCRDRFRDLTADCSAIVKPTQISFD